MAKVLGKGSYGSVYMAKQKATGQDVAAKILSKDSSIFHPICSRPRRVPQGRPQKLDRYHSKAAL